jgi:nucleotide-binding universal stress UspA family protein
VIGGRVQADFLDKLIGTSATHIALHSKSPVLVIPPQANPAKFQEGRICDTV